MRVVAASLQKATRYVVPGTVFLKLTEWPLNIRFLQLIGQNVYDVFRSTNPRARKDEIPTSLKPIEDILTGKTMEDVHEHCIDNRWYRTRFVPVLGKKGNGGQVNEAFIDGVIGVSMDVTEVKDKEETLQIQERENSRLLANEAAAKEASRLKSQFLANMSHEIRTPMYVSSHQSSPDFKQFLPCFRALLDIVPLGRYLWSLNLIKLCSPNAPSMLSDY
jgi:signal transduction histidine kinase